MIDLKWNSMNETTSILQSHSKRMNLVAFLFTRGLQMIDLEWNSLNERTIILESHSKHPHAQTIGDSQIPLWHSILRED
jgi:hypothetical protein